MPSSEDLEPAASETADPQAPLRPEVTRDARQRMTVRAASLSYNSPLPPPEILAGYGRTQADAPDRILAMAERQEAHRQQIKKTVVEAGAANASKGINVTAYLATLFVGASLYMVHEHYAVYGIVTLGSTLAALARANIYGKSSQQTAAYRLKRGGYLLRWTASRQSCFCAALNSHLMKAWLFMDGGNRPGKRRRNERANLGGNGQDDSILRITVGTVDAEWLAGHTQRDLLPRRWSELLGYSCGGIVKINPAVHLGDGFRIVLPALAAGEECQVQFVVASLNKEEAEDDVATWLAVDHRPEDILLGAGCL